MDTSKYEYLPLPQKESWGVLMRNDSPLAQKSVIKPIDLMEQPLIISHQDDVNGMISPWFKTSLSNLNIVATYNLIYNASILTQQNVGYTICFNHLINTENTNLVFKPLDPPLTCSPSIIWKKYQILSKPVEKYLETLMLEIKKSEMVQP